MAKGAYIGVEGKARKITGGYIGVDGKARKIVKAYIGVDGKAQLFWEAGGGPVILEVEKITSDTYAGETTYTGEQFILLDIYPKTNGTVSVTYGGLTKTITDTSGAEEPNAQQVFFGTFNGVSDGVATPANGTLTIEGDYYAFGGGGFHIAAKTYAICAPICIVTSFGSANKIPSGAFGGTSAPEIKFKQTELKIPSSIKSVGNTAFSCCKTIETVTISNGVEIIEGQPFLNCTGLKSLNIPKSVKSIGKFAVPELDAVSYLNPVHCTNSYNILSVDENNPYYKIDGNCLVEIDTNRLVSGFADSVIPDYITWLGEYCFSENADLKNVSIPNGVTIIGTCAFYGCTGVTRVEIPSSVTTIGYLAFSNCTGLTNIIVLATTPPTITASGAFDSTTCTITVPKGCGEAYKAAEYWSEYANRIVEAS